jgi:L-malate glycosyltransferase
LHITLVGPCSPRDLSDLFAEDQREFAEEIVGYRGVPVSLLARALLKAGMTVSIVTTAGYPIETALTFLGPNIQMVVLPHRNRARHRALDFFKLERQAIKAALIRINPDIIHAHWTYEFALAALSTKKPVLVTAHDAPMVILRQMRDPYRFIRTAMAYIVRLKTKNLTVVSPYLARKWHMEMFWRKQLPVIPNISPFLISGKSQQKNSPPTVISIGEAGPLKNLGALLKAWPLITAQVPSAVLHLIGNGLAVHEELAKWARKEGADQGVIWHGYLERDPLEKLLESACVLVHPSLEEAQPMVPLEAMSKGVPIVGGVNSGGVPWTIGDAGILVNVKSPQKIADATVKLLLDKELREELGKRGQDRIRLEFSSERVAKLYIARYQQILTRS